MTEKRHKYFEFEISLQGVEPKVWRRFLIHRQSTFGDLHKAIQVACGWKDYHLYSFSEQNPAHSYGPDQSTFAISPHDEPEGYEIEPEIATKYKLFDFFDDDDQDVEIFYVYDYGDGWIHSVKMIATRQESEKFKRRLIGGARAFPLEDCGGLPGYQQCVDAFYNKKHAEDDLLRWMGKWNPEFFDLKKTQGRFQPKTKKATGSIDSKEAMKDLAAFDKWAKNRPATKGTNVIDLRQRLRSKKSKE